MKLAGEVEILHVASGIEILKGNLGVATNLSKIIKLHFETICHTLFSMFRLLEYYYYCLVTCTCIPEKYMITPNFPFGFQ